MYDETLFLGLGKKKKNTHSHAHAELGVLALGGTQLSRWDPWRFTRAIYEVSVS